MTPVAPRAGGAALFWVVAIACLLACTAVLAAQMADRAKTAWEGALRSNVIALITAPDTPAGLEDAALALNSISEIENVRIVTPQRVEALLRDLGVDLAAKDLPAPRLITFDMTTPPTEGWKRRVQSQLQTAGLTIEIFGRGPNVLRAAEEAHKQADATLAIGALLAGAALLTVGLVGRTRTALDRDMIPPLADMGATRGQVSRMFASRSAVEGFAAGALGAIGVAAPLWWLLTYPDRFGAPFDEWASLLEWTDATPLAGAPLLAALLAAAGSRASSNRFYELAARRR